MIKCNVCGQFVHVPNGDELIDCISFGYSHYFKSDMEKIIQQIGRTN